MTDYISFLIYIGLTNKEDLPHPCLTSCKGPYIGISLQFEPSKTFDGNHENSLSFHQLDLDNSSLLIVALPARTLIHDFIRQNPKALLTQYI